MAQTFQVLRAAQGEPVEPHETGKLSDCLVDAARHFLALRFAKNVLQDFEFSGVSLY